MKIYIASPYAARDLAVRVAEELIQEGHIITSTWITSTREITPGTVGPTLDVSHEDVAEHAQGDFNDIDRSDILLMLSSNFVVRNADVPAEWLHTGGRHVECGYAWGTAKAVHILGEPENVFGRGLAYVHIDLKSFLSWAEYRQKSTTNPSAHLG